LGERTRRQQVSNKWMEEFLMSGDGGYGSLRNLASAVTIRQYQRQQGFPLTGMKFKIDGEWRDVDEILAGPDA
jgi:hypothetical protein